MRKKGKDKAKETLYVFFTLPGNFIAATFTGQKSANQRSTVLFHRAFHAGRFSLITSQSTVTAVFM